jgi:hypothetical protein
MRRKASRAYKLKLSDNGISLFLHCHCRLCHLVGDFLPYGTTLYVSVSLLERVPTDELVAELQDRELSAYGGREIRFVGTSPQLADTTAKLADRISETGNVHPTPQTWKLFLAALCCMQAADDKYVVRAYDQLCATEAGLKPRRIGADDPKSL